MSRVGKNPVPIPAGVTVQVDKGNRVTVKGPKGELSEQVSKDMEISQADGYLTVKRPTDQRHHRSLHGLSRALINNMVVGVTTGFTKRLEIHGVGYRAEKQGQTLVLQVGKSHPVEFEPPADTEFEVDRDGRGFMISGIDKCAVGQLAAVIRKSRPPEPYKGKGIRYQGEYVRRKEAKKK